MRTGNKRRNGAKRLAYGRPPVFEQKTTLSSKVTKILINKHHVLEKRRKQAMSKKDYAAVEAIESEMETLGGIKAYQQASLQGQQNNRGGDSSRVLMEWLDEAVDVLRESPLRMLEVGALSTTNACSASGCFSVERIDLNSQGDGIIQQDFMARPLPRDKSETFDIISLSLVLNFVPDAKERGTMLWRALAFLRDPGTSSEAAVAFFPSLFLVLPAPCILNSRYMDEGRLAALMWSLGFELVRSKITNKLVYYLWKRVPRLVKADSFLEKKAEVRSGSTRNNFTVLLDLSWPTWPVRDSSSRLTPYEDPS